MRIPLDKRLKKRLHREIGYLQDELMELLYVIYPDFVLHGGTEIWRCFSGTRFSEDLDLYAPNLPADFEKRLEQACAARGLRLQKFKKTENLVFSKIAGDEAEVRIEVNFSRKPDAAALPYEKMDGSALTIFAVPLEALVVEKAKAYLGRRLIRDLYDVYFLSGKLEEGEKAGRELASLLEDCPQPLDEETLPAIVYAGAVPTFAQMRRYLEGRFK